MYSRRRGFFLKPAEIKIIPGFLEDYMKKIISGDAQNLALVITFLAQIFSAEKNRIFTRDLGKKSNPGFFSGKY
ncbi:MAG: hypothetical protein DRJ11_06975 [Candidatus Aminicenantes bacterium]|nr:MAG: hypothetical protein DRJ11_06975 [Candidatus Aminicenantes bacterium]